MNTIPKMTFVVRDLSDKILWYFLRVLSEDGAMGVRLFRLPTTLPLGRRFLGCTAGTHQLDLFCTSTRVFRPLYFDLCTSTFCQIWTSYWPRRTGRSAVLVEVKFRSKKGGRSTEKVELMRTLHSTFFMEAYRKIY